MGDFLVFFWQCLTDRKFTLAAMGMAYRFFFAVFPALILIFTVIPYIPIDDLQSEVMDFLATVVPAESLGFLDLIIEEFFNRPSAGVIYLNLALLLYASMSGIKAMMFAFSKDSDLFTKRNFLRVNAVSLLIVIVLLFIFLFMLGLLISGELFINYLHTQDIIHDVVVSYVITGFYWLIVLAGLQAAFSVLYFLGPETTERFKFFSPGSFLAAGLAVLAITAFRFFFTNFANYNKIYGSIGAIMVLMVWFYWLSIVLLVGFEVNAAIAEVKYRYILRREELGADLSKPRLKGNSDEDEDTDEDTDVDADAEANANEKDESASDKEGE